MTTTLTTSVINANYSDIEVTFTVNPIVFPMFFVTTATVDGVPYSMDNLDMEQFYENAFECLYDTTDEALLALNDICEQTEQAHYAAA